MTYTPIHPSLHAAGASVLLLAVAVLPFLLVATALSVSAQAQAPSLVLTSPNPEPSLPFSGTFSPSTGVPDVNGDGRADILIGAPNENAGATDAGRAYLFDGVTGDLLRTLSSPNPEFRGQFGGFVSGVPDVNGDGRGDLLIAASLENAGATDAGRAYLFSGATGIRLCTLVSPNPETGGAFGGRGVSGVPDANGDGRGDLLISADLEDGGATNAGRAYLFSGATGAPLHTLSSPNPEVDGGFGFGVSAVPDADGDGRGDLLIGARFENVGSVTNAGRAYLFSGATGALLRTLSSPNPETNGDFGVAVSGVPDVDGDGRGDLLAGAREEDGGAEDAGRAYLFSGATGALVRTLQSPNPEEDGFFGGVAGVRDVDGDGLGDFLVTAPGESVGGGNEGRVYLYTSGSGGGLTVTASANPTVIPAGSSTTIAVQIANTTNQAVPLDLWVVVKANNNPVLTRRIGGGTLPANTSVIRSFMLSAPRGTPPGPYTVCTNVGDFPTLVLASDAVDVTVTGAPLVSSTGSALDFAVEALTGNVFMEDGQVLLASSASATAVAYPNPFVRLTRIAFSLNAPAEVRLAVYDVLGREVAVLTDGLAAAGHHEATFDAAGFPSGTYLWRLEAGHTVETGRLTLLR